MPTIVVLGAGVTGLTTALLLARRQEHTITVVAKHMPGDYDIEYSSPWAGANVLPMATEENSKYERDTWPELARLAADVPEAGIHFQKATIYRRDKDLAANRLAKMSESLFAEQNWQRHFFSSSWRDLAPDELPEGREISSGSEWQSVCINVPLYLSWLVGECRKLGVVFKRAAVKHVAEAALLSHVGEEGEAADLVVNASGLLASKLGGVMDDQVFPVRGQIVLVRNELEPMIAVSGSDDASDEIVYAMMRASGGGTILGGTFQVGSWESVPDPNIAVRIMKRVLQYHPQLRGKSIEDLDVVRHGVGLRPYRNGGVRLEKEKIDGVWVVHNYGHGGFGYQSSYGYAQRAVDLVSAQG